MDFPFETKQDRAHALALMLHDFARNLFDGPSPFFLIDKPIHGTGATILAGILCLPSFGRIVPNKNFSNSEEEVRKQITSHLMSGGGPYLYDNLPDNKRIDSDVLASVVTGKTYSDRALGTNTDVKLHNLGPWIGTGNNIDFAGQLRRRVLRIRLVSDNPTPYLRTGFRHEDIKKWAADNRADLVDACLTLVMAWINAGRPAWGGQPLGSFENFSKVMGGILKHAGVEGFMTNMDFQQDSGDSEEGQFRDLIQEWWNVKQNANLKVTEIVSLAELADLDIQNTWFDLNQKTKVSKAGKQIRKILDRTYLVETPQGPIRVQLIAGGVKSTYRLKEKSGDRWNQGHRQHRRPKLAKYVSDVVDVIPWTLTVQNQQTLSSLNPYQSKGTKMDMPTLYTPNEVADYLHVSRGTIYSLLRNNEIGSVKVGRNRRFTAGHVKEYLTKRGPEVVIDKLYSN